MKSELHPILEAIKPIVTGLARTFGQNFEIVLHDISRAESSVIAIENGHITNRKVGSPSTDLLMDMAHKNQNNGQDMELNYITNTDDGKQLKSSTFLIRDEKDKVIGALCINIDLTNIKIAQHFLDEITHTERDEALERFPQDAGNFLNLMINHSLEELNKPVPQLNKDDKLKIVSHLDQNNIFNIKGAVDILARKLGCSKYTIYNYLDEVRADMLEEGAE